MPLYPLRAQFGEFLCLGLSTRCDFNHTFAGWIGFVRFASTWVLKIKAVRSIAIGIFAEKFQEPAHTFAFTPALI